MSKATGMTSRCGCLGRNGLELFGTTADERWTLGEHLFLATHVPVRLRRYRQGGDWSEGDLLDALLAPHTRGNRVFALYGAAGSGKSELLRWLQHAVAQHDPARIAAMVRLSRTDLGAPALLSRLAPLLPPGSGADQMWQRWEEARRAPVALTNALVWTALGRLVPDDEACIPAAYALRPLIEHALREALGGPVASKPFDVLWGDDLHRAAADHPALGALDEELLRRELVRAFDTLVLPAPGVGHLLRAAGAGATERGLRPLLLVDDLVQALPTHAAEILDWVTTLDEGSWDVVVGLTPGSLQHDARTRALLDRVTRLETFDDRMCKLWLSDEAGHACYALPEDAAVDLLRVYLGAYRRANAPTCRCADDPDLELWPFTPAIARRLYRAVPPGKGAPRHLLLAARTALAAIARGGAPDEVLAHVVPPEASARHPRPEVGRALEVYGALKRGRLILDRALARRLGLGDATLSAQAEALMRAPDTGYGAPEAASTPEPDLSTVAIRTWLRGDAVNPQGLRELRLGVSRFGRLVGHGLGRPGAARTATLRLTRTGNGTCPAVCVDGVDATDGIRVGPWIGDLAYDLARLARADARATLPLLRRIFSTVAGARLVWAVHAFEERARREIDAALEAPLPVVVAQTRRLVGRLWSPSTPLLPVLDADVHPPAASTAGDLAPGRPLRSALDDLVADLFCLRENVWDGEGLAAALGADDDAHLLADTLQPQPGSIDPAYRVGDYPLSDLLRDVRDSLREAAPSPEDRRLDEACVAVLRRVHIHGCAEIEAALRRAAGTYSFLSSRWADHATRAHRAATTLSTLDEARCVRIAQTLDHEGVLVVDGKEGRAMWQATRRHAILVEAFSARERAELHAVMSALDDLTSHTEALRADLCAAVCMMAEQLVVRIRQIIGSRHVPARRPYGDGVRPPSLDRLMALSQVYSDLGQAHGTLDRVELALYRCAVEGRPRRTFHAQLRALSKALPAGRPTILARQVSDMERMLAAEELGVGNAGDIRGIEALRTVIPAPRPWARPLLRALLTQSAVSLGEADERALRRVRRQYPGLDDILYLTLAPSQDVRTGGATPEPWA